MASIRERTSKSGETTYSVLYRHGRKQTSKSFLVESEAEEFKILVDLLGPDRALKAAADDQREDALTVSELAAQYLAWVQNRVTVRTWNDYSRDYRNWVEPWLGHMAADLVDEGDVQRWVDHMAGKISPKTVGDKHMILHSIYEYGRARSRRLVEHNPCRETELPKRGKRKPPKGTTVPEFRALLSAAERNPGARDLLLFLGETGWRFSEATALAVRDVEDNGHDVWVTVRQVFRLDESGRQYLAEDEAKSAAGFRRIRMFPETAAMLRRRVIGRGPADFVFTNSHDLHWKQNTFLRSTWPVILRRAELGDRSPTPHWLRHMHVAVCAAAGVPMHEIQRRIGHENYSTTVDVYGGMIGDMSDDAMEAAAALMSGQRTAPTIAPVVAGEIVEAVVFGELS